MLYKNINLEVTRTANSPYLFRNANPLRDWMDETFSNHAYRCVPLVNANSYGWEIVLPSTVIVRKDENGIVSIIQGEYSSGFQICGTSIQNESIAFYPHMAFLSDSGYSLLCTQPPNLFIDGAQAYTAIIPTSWWAESFQFSWRITKTNEEVIFPAGTPILFCFLIDNLISENTTVNLFNVGENSKIKNFKHLYEKHATQKKDKKWRSVMKIEGTLGGENISSNWHKDNPQPPQKLD